MLDEKVVSSVAIGNLKAISEQPAMLSNLAYSNVVTTTNLSQQNSVSNQQAVNELGISVLAKGTNTVSNLDPMQARSAVDILTNNELAQTIADLKATLEGFSGGGKAGKGLLRAIKALVEAGVSVDEKGFIVVPPGKRIVVPGAHAKEDIQITLEANAVIIDVKV